MKRDCFILMTLIVNGALFSLAGCQRQAPVAKEPILQKEPQPQTPPKKVEALPEAPQPKVVQAPEITFEKTVHDFGEISPSTNQQCEFKFTNTGSGILKITNISRTCGCTVHTLAKKQYAPGESGTLKVRYYAGKYPGTVNKHLTVSSNDKKNPKVTLAIQATIVPKVKYEPQRLSLLLKKENAGCPEITLTSIDNKPFSISRFMSTANSITADIDPSVQATKFVLRPKVDVETLKKNLNGRIDISLTHPQCNKISIYYSTVPRFKTNPPSILILNPQPNKTIQRDVWILNNYGEEFEIASVSSKNKLIKVISQQKVRNGYQFKLQITPPALEGKPRFFSDEFIVNIEDGELLRIYCRGYYSPKSSTGRLSPTKPPTKDVKPHSE